MVLLLPQEIVGHWSAMGMGAESSEQGQMTCGVMELALLGTASVSQFSFIPAHREHIGLGMVTGDSPNLH